MIKRLSIGKNSSFRIIFFSNLNFGNIFTLLIKNAINSFQGENASFISIRDITERKRMQEKLERSEQKYRNLEENAHYGIIINQFGKLKFVIKVFCSMVEYTEEELIESDFMNVVVEDEKTRIQ